MRCRSRANTLLAMKGSAPVHRPLRVIAKTVRNAVSSPLRARRCLPVGLVGYVTLAPYCLRRLKRKAMTAFPPGYGRTVSAMSAQGVFLPTSKTSTFSSAQTCLIQ